MQGSEKFENTFSLFGNSFEFDANLFASIKLFVCAIYGIRCSNTNDAWYKMFCSSRKAPEPQKLPPTRNTLLCHCKRLSYVTAVIKRSLQNSSNIPSPISHGWKVENGVLSIDWMLLLIALADVLELISCNCTNRCVGLGHVFADHMVWSALICAVAAIVKMPTRLTKKLIVKVVIAVMINTIPPKKNNRYFFDYIIWIYLNNSF